MQSFRAFQCLCRTQPLRSIVSTARAPARNFTTTPPSASGHSRWSKIKHDKGKADARRGASFSKLSQEVTNACKEGGNDSSNLRLNAAIAAAKKAGMPKDRINTAIQRGLGKSASGVALEPVLVEGMGPGNVALVIDALTDSKLRALQDIKYILNKYHGQSTPSGYLFTRKGVLHIPAGSGGYEFDSILETALEIEGTEDVEEGMSDEGTPEFIITTDPSKVGNVAAELRNTMPGLQLSGYGMEWVPNEDTMVEVPPGDKSEGLLQELIEKLEESPEVVSVYTNAK
ncbi:transcriptional regulator TACO1-like protein [Pyronema omphalodes]|nr:transcriptional regulator TACO1-like protein [Pyronema omphalodes]